MGGGKSSLVQNNDLVSLFTLKWLRVNSSPDRE